MRITILTALASAALILTGCGVSENPDTQPAAARTNSVTQTNAPGAEDQTIYEVKGVVQEVKAAEKKVVVKHEEVPDYMPAMTMPFDVKNTNELAGLNASAWPLKS